MIELKDNDNINNNNRPKRPNRPQLWLDPIPLGSQDEARACFAERDVSGFLFCAHNSDGMDLVLENAAELKRMGMYEEALVAAFTGCTVNHSEMPLRIIRIMFRAADRAKLRGLYPLEGTGPFTLYRGVSGKGAARRVRGVSWTDDLDKAKWWANRLSILYEHPAVHEVVVPAKHILLFTNERNEREYIVALPPEIRTKKVWSA